MSRDFGSEITDKVDDVCPCAAANDLVAEGGKVRLERVFARCLLADTLRVRRPKRVRFPDGARQLAQVMHVVFDPSYLPQATLTSQFLQRATGEAANNSTASSGPRSLIKPHDDVAACEQFVRPAYVDAFYDPSGGLRDVSDPCPPLGVRTGRA